MSLEQGPCVLVFTGPGNYVKLRPRLITHSTAARSLARRSAGGNSGAANPRLRARRTSSLGRGDCTQPRLSCRTLFKYRCLEIRPGTQISPRCWPGGPRPAWRGGAEVGRAGPEGGVGACWGLRPGFGSPGAKETAVPPAGDAGAEPGRAIPSPAPAAPGPPPPTKQPPRRQRPSVPAPRQPEGRQCEWCGPRCPSTKAAGAAPAHSGARVHHAGACAHGRTATQLRTRPAA